MRKHANDRDRLSRWARQHGRAVRGYLLAMVGNADVADDLVQEVFRRAWQARHRYQENGSARAYLLKIADRLVFDRARKSKREVNLDAGAWQQLEPASDLADPSAGLEQEEARRQLAAALRQLSPPQRRVLLLRYYGQMSFAQIARAMNCPLNTALSHCHRGLASLRKQLVEQPE